LEGNGHCSVKRYYPASHGDTDEYKSGVLLIPLLHPAPSAVTAIRFGNSHFETS
jgi:hypothetical protein